MATITHMRLEAEIIKLMKTYSEKFPTKRSLELSPSIEIYLAKVPYGKIFSLTILPSDKVLLKVEFYNLNKNAYTLFSLGNFDENTLEKVLLTARESMASVVL